MKRDQLKELLNKLKGYLEDNIGCACGEAEYEEMMLAELEKALEEL
jgi:hypothetical protein